MGGGRAAGASSGVDALGAAAIPPPLPSPEDAGVGAALVIDAKAYDEGFAEFRAQRVRWAALRKELRREGMPDADITELERKDARAWDDPDWKHPDDPETLRERP